MANLTKEQVQKIIDNAPAGSDSRKIVEGLVQRGHTLEGLNTQSVQSSIRVEEATKGNQFEETKKKGFIESARDFVVGAIGGGKLAEGAGMAIAAPEIQKQQEDRLQQQQEVQSTLIKRIREKKAAGEDTTRLRRALDMSLETGQIEADIAQDFVDSLPTDKQVIGSAIRLAGTALAPTIAGQATKLTGATEAVTVAGGALRGAGAGALTGSIEGAIQSGGMAAEANKPTEEILLSGALGAVGGALFGGALGAVAGGVGGGIKSSQIKKEQFASQFAAPKETYSVKTEAIRQGRFTDPGLFKRAQIQTSRRSELLAESINDVVSPKATLGQNIDAIRLKIDQVDDGVREYITSNKVPFNTNQLRTKLVDGKSELELIFASESNAEKTYDAVTSAFMKEVGKKDTLGLFEARQNFDQIPSIQKLLSTDKLGENARKEIVLAVRRSANDYIASLLPSGNQYKTAMLQQSYALEALGNIAEKSATIIGKNSIQLLSEQYPILKWVVGGIVGGSIAGGVGAGSTFISSSDSE